jgi:MarR family transcriptional regulator, lower aerobic nicotinate degradation pathway regulator
VSPMCPVRTVTYVSGRSFSLSFFIPTLLRAPRRKRLELREFRRVGRVRDGAVVGPTKKTVGIVVGMPEPLLVSLSHGGGVHDRPYHLVLLLLGSRRVTPRIRERFVARRRHGPIVRRRAIKGYVLEQQIGHLLRRAHQRASGIFIAELGGSHGVTPTQYAALVKLRDVGEQSQNELGRLIATDPATTQGVIARLIRRRLVERSRDPGDGRRSKLRLTRRGLDLVERLIPLGVRITAQTLRPLTAREQKLFLRLLSRLAGTST